MAEHVRAKICGLTRNEDVRAADEAGADYLGVVLSAGFGRSVDPHLAAEVVHGARATRVAVLVDEDADGCVLRADAIGAGVVQLHGHEDVALARELRRRGPWTIWKSTRVRTPGDVLRAVDVFGDAVDGLLVEGWQEGVVGGGGVRMDPEALQDVRHRIPPRLELILAGGLTPDTVAAEVARIGPDVVDVSSGVERELGRKDHDLVRRFIEAVRSVRLRAPGGMSRP